MSKKADLIVDFTKVELTYDTVRLQEDIKQLQVENALLRDNLGTFQETTVEKDKL